jgi:hypothetical protein
MSSGRRTRSLVSASIDPLWQAGSAPGVQDVQIVSPARGKVPLRCPRAERLFESHCTRRGIWLCAVVVDHEEVSQLRELRRQCGNVGGKALLVYQGDEVGVGEQVSQFVVDVAVIDVDPHGSKLEDGPRRLHPFGAVEGVDADVVSRTDTHRGQVVGQTVGPLVHLCVGEPPSSGNQVLAVAESVHRPLEKVGKVELHPHKLEQVPLRRDSRVGQPEGAGAPQLVARTSVTEAAMPGPSSPRSAWI